MEDKILKISIIIVAIINILYYVYLFISSRLLKRYSSHPDFYVLFYRDKYKMHNEKVVSFANVISKFTGKTVVPLNKEMFDLARADKPTIDKIKQYVNRKEDDLK